MNCRVDCLVLAMCVSFAGLAYAQTRLELKGVKIGDTLQIAKAKFPQNARCQNAGRGSICSIDDVSFGTTSGTLYLHLEDGNIVEAVTVEFKQSAFSDVLAALSIKYGRPQSVETVTLQNRMGAKFESQIALWLVGDEQIRAVERDTEVETSSVRIQSLKRIADENTRRRERLKEAAKNL